MIDQQGLLSPGRSRCPRTRRTSAPLCRRHPGRLPHGLHWPLLQAKRPPASASAARSGLHRPLIDGGASRSRWRDSEHLLEQLLPRHRTPVRRGSHRLGHRNGIIHPLDIGIRARTDMVAGPIDQVCPPVMGSDDVIPPSETLLLHVSPVHCRNSCRAVGSGYHPAPVGQVDGPDPAPPHDPRSLATSGRRNANSAFATASFLRA